LSEITPPGSFGLAVIAGKTGKLVQWGQNIVDGRKETYTHAFFVLDKGEVIEAEPGGAEINPISKYLGREDVLFSDKPVQSGAKLLSVGKPRGFGGYAADGHGRTCSWPGRYSV
jgi:hypothetical protein